MRCIVIASGKGGVGKSSIALNLAYALRQAGQRVLVIDTDVAMASLGLAIGIERTPISLHNVLSGDAKLKEATYESQGVKLVPSALSIEHLRRGDFARLREAIKEVGDDYDFVLLDCAPGLGPDAELALRAGDELLLVATPDSVAVADALKVKAFAARAGMRLLGVVVNRVTGARNELRAREVQAILELPILAQLPESKEVYAAALARRVAVATAPVSEFARGVYALANALTGVRVAPVKRPGFFARLLMALGLRRRA